jgi:hypothetical protein
MVVGLEGLGQGVISYGGRVGMNDCAETPSVQVTIHDFGSMSVVQEVRNLKTVRPNRGATLIVGTEGYLSGGAGGTSVYDPDGRLIQKLSGPSEDHFANFVKAVRSRKRADLNAEVEEGHISTAVVHVGNLSQRLGRPASPREIERVLETLNVNENVVETFREIQQHLADNGVDIEKTPLTIGPWLEIDSDNERFVNSPTANAMLTRDYRKPFVVPPANEI